MRDDLLDAQAALDWAMSQIPLLQEQLLEWSKQNPCEIVHEPHPDGQGDAGVVYDPPFPLMFNAWVGALINSMRSALDLVAAALARRNGKDPADGDVYFPILGSAADLNVIERKTWLTLREKGEIKSLRPYQGGDDCLWPLHRADITRKHHRLIFVRPEISGFLYQSGTPGGTQGYMMIGGQRGIERMGNKTVLYRLPLNKQGGTTHVAVFVSFDEGAIGLADKEVATLLETFGTRVREVIKTFEY